MRDPPFVEGRLECHDERGRILREEELAVGDHAAGIIDEGDELGLGGGFAVLQEGADHGVELPHLVGELFGEGQTALILRLGDGGEQIVLADQPEEAGLGAIAAGECPLFNAPAVDHHLVIANVTEAAEHLGDGFLQLFGGDLAGLALVSPGAVCQRLGAELLIDGQLLVAGRVRTDGYVARFGTGADVDIHGSPYPATKGCWHVPRRS